MKPNKPWHWRILAWYAADAADLSRGAVVHAAHKQTRTRWRGLCFATLSGSLAWALWRILYAMAHPTHHHRRRRRLIRTLHLIGPTAAATRPTAHNRGRGGMPAKAKAGKGKVRV
jgi:membrane protein implicated in regulation of membrane protease activity